MNYVIPTKKLLTLPTIFNLVVMKHLQEHFENSLMSILQK